MFVNVRVIKSFTNCGMDFRVGEIIRVPRPAAEAMVLEGVAEFVNR